MKNVLAGCVMSTTHTPGPWHAKWSKYDQGVYLVQAGMPSMRVLASFDGDGDGPDKQSIADAHLIAATPDLLNALQLCVEALTSVPSSSYNMVNPYWYGVVEVAVSDGQRALAKAVQS